MQLEPGKQRREAGTQRTIAATLLVVLILPILTLFLSLSSQNYEAMLPACCRSHGKHRCFMRRVAAHSPSTSDGPAVSQMSERCPYFPPAPSPQAPTQFGSPS